MLITIVGLVVDRGGMVDSVVDRGSVVDSVVNSMVGNWGMVGNYRGSMNCMVNNWGMHCMVNSRGGMMDSMATESCERNGWPTSHKGDKSNQSKDLTDERIHSNIRGMQAKSPIYFFNLISFNH